jgi:hypothetical protein
MHRLAAYPRQNEGEPVPGELFAHIAPLGWEHITL